MSRSHWKCEQHDDCFALDYYGRCHALQDTTFSGECPFYKTANEYWLFLEELRRSGKTNMFGAVPYLQEAFKYEEMTRAEASKILTEWMKNYDADDYE